MKFSFTNNRKVFFGISIVLVVATLVSFLTLGFNWDIEFVGGTELTFELDKNVTKEDEKAIEDAVVAIIGNDSFSSVRVANGNEAVVRTTLVDTETNYDELNAAIGNKITALYSDATLVSATQGQLVYSIPSAIKAEEEAPVVEENTEAPAEENVEAPVEEAPAVEENTEVTEGDATTEASTEGDVAAAVTNEEAPAEEEATVEAVEEIAEEPVAAPEAADEAEATEETTEEITEVEAQPEVAPETAIRTALGDGSLALSAVNVTENEEGQFVVVYDPASEVNFLRKEIEDAVNALYPLAEGSEETTRLTGMSTVSAEVSDSLKSTAVSATLLAVVLMLVYIAFRFKSVAAALAAVVCLAHDVLIMLLSYSVFQIPVSSTVIAAILTILGYSINATIVIFDRIRENYKLMSASTSFDEKVDSGIKSTLWRSLNTTITTLITIGLIYFMGVTSIKNFALPLIVGILSGVYSSVCLSGNLWSAFKKIDRK